MRVSHNQCQLHGNLMVCVHVVKRDCETDRQRGSNERIDREREQNSGREKVSERKRERERSSERDERAR